MLREQAEADEQVGLAAAHRLLEVEDRLGRGSGQPGNAFADQVLHALRDVRLLEEGRAVAFGGDQFVELLDLVAELDRQRIRLKLAGIADGFHMVFTSAARVGRRPSLVLRVSEVAGFSLRQIGPRRLARITAGTVYPPKGTSQSAHS